jgi:hypothetical protein
MSEENVEVRNEAVRRFFAAFEAPPPRAADPTPNNRRKQK